jgi:[acyl-carrier-protein] S-malonyltransferase
MSLALLFPGQGSQFVGMAGALIEAHDEARRTFEEAHDVLGFSLASIMTNGPEEELTATKNAQPAILTHSVAVLRILGDRVGEAVFAAGHSLGEFSAHVAAGTLSFADALDAVRLRGELMHEAGEERAGTMAAVLGLSEEDVEAALSGVTAGVCVPANFNSSGQVVISGDLAGVEEGSEACRQAGAKRVVPLDVSGAFHSPLMAPAAQELQAKLKSLDFADPAYPVISNVTARPVTDGGEARSLLVEQLTSPVRWADSVVTMTEAGVSRFVEVGPGSVLCGLNRRNARGVPCTSVGEPEDVQAFAS